MMEIQEVVVDFQIFYYLIRDSMYKVVDRHGLYLLVILTMVIHH